MVSFGSLITDSIFAGDGPGNVLALREARNGVGLGAEMGMRDDSIRVVLVMGFGRFYKSGYPWYV